MRNLRIAFGASVLLAFNMSSLASADVVLTVSPDIPSAVAGQTVTLSLFMTTEVGTSTDNTTFSIRCVSCSLGTFVFNEAFAPDSGVVQFGANKVTGPFAVGGTSSNLNTSGSIMNAGDGLGIVEYIEWTEWDDWYVGSIGFVTATQPLNGDGLPYLIGTLTATIDEGATNARVEPIFRLGEGIFNLAPAVPTVFEEAVLPEPGSALLQGLALGAVALLRRRRR